MIIINFCFTVESIRLTAWSGLTDRSYKIFHTDFKTASEFGTGLPGNDQFFYAVEVIRFQFQEINSGRALH